MITITHKKFCANLTLKKIVMLIGLLLVLLSMFEQASGDYEYQNSNGAKVSMLQLDKDHHRDVEEAVLAFQILGNGILLFGLMICIYNVLYQEPTLLVNHRPPNF